MLIRLADLTAMKTLPSPLNGGFDSNEDDAVAQI